MPAQIKTDSIELLNTALDNLCYMSATVVLPANIFELLALELNQDAINGQIKHKGVIFKKWSVG